MASLSKLKAEPQSNTVQMKKNNLQMNHFLNYKWVHEYEVYLIYLPASLHDCRVFQVM